MHTVELPLDGLDRRLPAICLITGEVAGVGWRRVDLGWYPSWATWLLLPGLLPGAIAIALLARRATGELPFQPGAWWRWKVGQVLNALATVGWLAAVLFSFNRWLAGEWRLACAVAVAGLATFVGTLKLFVQGRIIVVLKITPTHVVLSIPSELAARALGGEPAVESQRLRAVAMKALRRDALATTGAPGGSSCATHAQTSATWCCGRCGSFFCEACAEHPSPAGKPVCAKCFGVR